MFNAMKSSAGCVVSCLLECDVISAFFGMIIGKCRRHTESTHLPQAGRRYPLSATRLYRIDQGGSLKSRHTLTLLPEANQRSPESLPWPVFCNRPQRQVPFYELAVPNGVELESLNYRISVDR